MALSVGSLLEGKYRVERVLGRGGMGTVYEARHTAINRRVAVKVLRGSLAEDADMVQRFEREALAASSVKSPYVVEVFDAGRLPTGEHYMILEYLDGESLSARLSRLKTMSPAQIFPLVAELLEGLAAAHAAGIVHRDLKPANVFLARTHDGSEIVKVLDFGVSKLSMLGGEGVTHTGALVGTPHYMAPEQTKGARNADHRSDLYAVGAILFRALAGRPPVVAETIHELIAKLITERAPRLGDVVPGISPEAAVIVDRALERDPADRYSTAREMIEAVRGFIARPEADAARSHPGSGERSHSGSGERSLARAGEDDAPTIATPSSSALSASSLQSSSVPGSLPWSSQPSAPSSALAMIGEHPHDGGTLATPSPATMDTPPPQRRSRVPFAVAGAVAVLVVGSVGAVAISGGDGAPAGDEAPARAAEPRPDPSPHRQATPSSDDGEDDTRVEAPPDQEPAEGRAAETATSSKPEGAEAKGASKGSGGKTPPASTAAPKAPRPIQKPTPTPSPKPVERDFREDI